MTDWEYYCIKYWRRVLTGKLAHFCYEFDDLPIDETCSEIAYCNCFEKELRVGTVGWQIEIENIDYFSHHTLIGPLF